MADSARTFVVVLGSLAVNLLAAAIIPEVQLLGKTHRRRRRQTNLKPSAGLVRRPAAHILSSTAPSSLSMPPFDADEGRIISQLTSDINSSTTAATFPVLPRELNSTPASIAKATTLYSRSGVDDAEYRHAGVSIWLAVVLPVVAVVVLLLACSICCLCIFRRRARRPTPLGTDSLTSSSAEVSPSHRNDGKKQQQIPKKDADEEVDAEMDRYYRVKSAAESLRTMPRDPPTSHSADTSVKFRVKPSALQLPNLERWKSSISSSKAATARQDSRHILSTPQPSPASSIGHHMSDEFFEPRYTSTPRGHERLEDVFDDDDEEYYGGASSGDDSTVVRMRKI